MSHSTLGPEKLRGALEAGTIGSPLELWKMRFRITVSHPQPGFPGAEPEMRVLVQVIYESASRGNHYESAGSRAGDERKLSKEC